MLFDFGKGVHDAEKPCAVPAGVSRRMVELVRSGRTPEELSREFEPSAQAIRNWVCQVDLDEGRRSDGLTTEEQKSRRLVCSGDRLVPEKSSSS
jgi:hypothetical protein